MQQPYNKVLSMTAEQHQWLMDTLKANVELIEKRPYGFSVPFRQMIDHLLKNLEHAINVPEGVEQYAFAHDVMKKEQAIANKKHFPESVDFTKISESIKMTVQAPTSNQYLFPGEYEANWTFTEPVTKDISWHSVHHPAEEVISISCDKHAGYTGKRTPRTGCKTCWDLYNKNKSLKAVESQHNIAKAAKVKKLNKIVPGITHVTIA